MPYKNNILAFHNTNVKYLLFLSLQQLQILKKKP